MNDAIFVVRDGLVATNIPSCQGPFASESELLKVAPTFPPGNYTIYGGAQPGKTFVISTPQFTLGEAKPAEPAKPTPQFAPGAPAE